MGPGIRAFSLLLYTEAEVANCRFQKEIDTSCAAGKGYFGRRNALKSAQ